MYILIYFSKEIHINSFYQRINSIELVISNLLEYQFVILFYDFVK